MYNCIPVQFLQANCIGADFPQAVKAGSTVLGCQGADYRIFNCIPVVFTQANCIGADFPQAVKAGSTVLGQISLRL